MCWFREGVEANVIFVFNYISLNSTDWPALGNIIVHTYTNTHLLYLHHHVIVIIKIIIIVV